MKIQHWILKQADKRFALLVIFFLTFCESIFLFIPPELFIAPTIVANKKKTKWVVVAATLGSLAGGLVAYIIGAWLFQSVGIPIIENFSSMEKFEHAKLLLNKYGLLIIFFVAFSPVPYKLLAIAAGFVRFNPILFILVSNVFRGLRFAITAYIISKYQKKAEKLMTTYFWPVFIISLLIMIFGIYIITLL